jgi:hypothetical protein
METILTLPLAAIEYSLIYMLGGGGLIGAVVIFAIANDAAIDAWTEEGHPLMHERIPNLI